MAFAKFRWREKIFIYIFCFLTLYIGSYYTRTPKKCLCTQFIYFLAKQILCSFCVGFSFFQICHSNKNTSHLLWLLINSCFIRFYVFGKNIGRLLYTDIAFGIGPEFSPWIKIKSQKRFAPVEIFSEICARHFWTLHNITCAMCMKQRSRCSSIMSLNLFTLRFAFIK